VQLLKKILNLNNEQTLDLLWEFPTTHLVTQKPNPMKNKRLLICTIGGLLSGIICYSIAIVIILD